MKALWLVSFRPIGKSKINDFYQNLFVDSIKSLDFDITFSFTQFDETNVKNFIDGKDVKNYYINIPKSDLPANKKYSNKLMLDNALNQYSYVMRSYNSDSLLSVHLCHYYNLFLFCNLILFYYFRAKHLQYFLIYNYKHR